LPPARITPRQSMFPLDFRLLATLASLYPFRRESELGGKAVTRN
jgi:hypothetical protein